MVVPSPAVHPTVDHMVPVPELDVKTFTVHLLKLTERTKQRRIIQKHAKQNVF